MAMIYIATLRGRTCVGTFTRPARPPPCCRTAGRWCIPRLKLQPRGQRRPLGFVREGSSLSWLCRARAHAMSASLAGRGEEDAWHGRRGLRRGSNMYFLRDEEGRAECPSFLVCG